MKPVYMLMFLGVGALAQAEREVTPPAEVPIKDLVSYAYDGSWDQLPDFSKLKPAAVEEQHKGLISLRQSGKSDNFGMVWEGTITAPKAGTFTFVIRSDDGSRLIVDGKTVVEMIGTQSEKTQERNVRLKQGDHPIRIEYLQNGGKQVIGLAMRGPGTNGWRMMSEGSVELPAEVPIKDLRSSVYIGSWDQLPDFSKLKPAAVEEQHKGIISLRQSGKSDNFGMVWEGTITAPKAGTFTFVIRSDDGSRLIVAGKTVVEMIGIQSEKTQERNVKLEQGDHPIRIEYLQNAGKEVIGLAMRGAGIDGWLMMSEGNMEWVQAREHPDLPARQ